jgi:phage gp36-like protein
MGYAIVSDFYRYGLPENALGAKVTPALIQAALDVRSAWADSKMAARYKLPLGTPYDLTIVMNICVLAAYDLMSFRGFNPENGGADANIRLRAEDAIRWFNDVERQAAHPNVIEATSPSPAIASPLVLSDPPRGWIRPFGGGSGIPG